jgi:isopentenyl phosphate kinase
MRGLELSQPRPTVLKIGGSVITDKNKELGVQMEAISRIADEILEANMKNLIIVHGGGSFGHPVAQKHAIKEGFKEETQIIGFAETHHVMTVLNGLFMDALIWRGIPAVSITPSSCIMTQNGRIICFEDTPLKQLTNMGFIPVLYGDAVFDTELGFTILSGDQLVSFLAMRFNAKNIVIGVDVDGLYDVDPKTDAKAKMFDHLTLKELKNVQKLLGGSNACDVTGGMANKIVELIPVIEHGIPVLIVNATKPKYICKALKGERVKGTFIEKE